MGSIRDKLRSQRGASILLALLFFLVCAMVGASVLMAAASNAGKSRSSREEQQKYLTLSSAMQLVCDELTAAEYSAEFVRTKTEEVLKTIVTENGSYSVHDYYKYYYEQKSGSYTGGFSKNVLPVLNTLDGLFAKGRLPVTEIKNSDHYIYSSSFTVSGDQAVELELAVTDPDSGTGLNLPVKVTVVLKQDPAFRIYVTARLAEDESYSMYAELICGTVPQIEAGKATYGPIKWTLSQITRKEPTTW